jgi:acetamidase/formamidase
MTLHLPAGSQSVHWGYFDPQAKPVLHVGEGQDVRIETLSGGARNLPEEGSGLTVLPAHRAVLEALKPELGPHILTGPVHVAGAEPGDRLIVEISQIDLAQDWGWNAIEPGFGIFPDLAQAYENITIPIDRERRQARLPWGPVAALEPFFGILAVAPHASGGRVGSVAPGPFGGNIDNLYARAGARIEFPVFCDGALFFAGDGHALQGDGEVCDTALETALNGTFRFSVEKRSAPPAPEIFIDDLMITMAFDEDLDRAAEVATARMMDLLEQRTGLSRTTAWRHCSLFASLRITQVVNRKKGVHCVLSRSSLDGL